VKRFRKAGLVYIPVALIVLSYITAAVLFIDDYGLTCDEPHNFGAGEKYLHFYGTGHIDVDDDIPHIDNHPDFYIDRLRSHIHVVSPLANILSAVTCAVFFRKLRLFDPVPAHHLIIPVLMVIFLPVLFTFVRKYWGSVAGLITLITLLTYPYFFGNSMNNSKGMPETIFFSLTVIFFAEWVVEKKIRYLYAFFFVFGCALATKIDAVLIPPVLFLWQVLGRDRKDFLLPKRAIPHAIAGGAMTLLIVLTSYWPLLRVQPDMFTFIANKLSYLRYIGTSPNISWNLYAPMQIVYRTPVPMLILFALGLVWIFSRFRANRLNALLAAWVLFPVMRHCLPYNSHYDGVRHFFVFVVPFAIIISLGARYLAGLCSRFAAVNERLSIPVITCILFATNLHILVSLHPYQTTYFNRIAGGLKGAQEKDIPYACDYWYHSYREAGAWLDENAEDRSNYAAYPFGYLITYAVSRDDLTYKDAELHLDDGLPPHTYVVLIPKKRRRAMLPRMNLVDLNALLSSFTVVHEIRRQGGIIFTIYYNG
jgi:hypothetical protein